MVLSAGEVGPGTLGPGECLGLMRLGLGGACWIHGCLQVRGGVMLLPGRPAHPVASWSELVAFATIAFESVSLC